eukprot:TRINITY_DN7234_c0_g3_i1.p1 TRINITY_DN7234_c0_g3~~TRINITY_DN7234_c0_g3_i1.p1  ORF type:complete len:182 (+),score=31.09 TRINITY_DN7234_c0_g3_i1:194-739(+)
MTERSSSDASNKLLGDVYVLFGAALYAISNVGQEHIVKSYDRIEYLGMTALFGTFISGLQMAILERDNLTRINWRDPSIWGYQFGFCICMVFLYSCIPIMLQISTAATMNLSFLTSDFFSVLFAVFLFSARLVPLYFVAFFIIIGGLVVFNLSEMGWFTVEWMAVCKKKWKGLHVVENNSV